MAKPLENHGIPEVPTHLDPVTRQFLQQLRNVVVRQAGTKGPIQIPTNLRVTPVAYGNVIDFTRSNADSYTLWWSTSADSSKASPIPIGQQARYHHDVAKDGVKVWYWIQPIINNLGGTLVGPKSGTTLASNVPVTLPRPPAPNSNPTVDSSTGRQTTGGSNIGNV